MENYTPWYLRWRGLRIDQELHGRHDQDIWNLVGMQPEIEVLMQAYASFDQWARSVQEIDRTADIRHIIWMFEEHTYDRFASEYHKPSDELKITPKHTVDSETSFTDNGASWTPEQDLLSTVPDGYNDFFN